MTTVTRPTIIAANGRPAVGQSLRELWGFREVVWAFTERTVRLKYKQAALGVAWSVIQPLSFLAVFTIIFGRFAGVSAGTTPYPAFALSALVSWFFLQSSVSLGAESLVRDAALVRKVFFPKEAPILGAVLSSTLDFAIGVALLLLVGPWLGAQVSWTILFLAPLWVVLALLAAGMAMALGALNVYYRDFRYALPLFLQLWMFASPVAYPLSAVPPQWRSIYISLNPAAGLLDGIRRILAEGSAPDLSILAISAAGTATIVVFGYLLFKRLEPEFADAV
jgi:lipopolysaccharide transport system permease protein